LYFQYILKLFLRTTSKELERTELAQGHPKNYFAGPWGQVKLRRVLAEMVQKLILSEERIRGIKNDSISKSVAQAEKSWIVTSEYGNGRTKSQ
jgi:hypothetical protein